MKAVFTTVTIESPVVKIIITRRSVYVILSLLILACNHRLLPRVDRERTGIAGNLPLSVTNGYVCLEGIGIGIDSILAGTINQELKVCGLDLEVFTTVNPANPQ